MIKGWEDFFTVEEQQPYYKKLMESVSLEYQNNMVYPPYEAIFRAYELCSYNDTKVVIVGQDPYHELNQANGLCFSVSPLVKNPPSLVNIFKELESDLSIKRDNSDLSDWARQGVLLLNRVLTVRAGVAYSHESLGWQNLTLRTIMYLNRKQEPIIFVLWGKKAQELEPYLDLSKHYLIKSAHPSPLSAYNGFFNSKPFSKINEYLKSTNQSTISFGG